MKTRERTIFARNQSIHREITLHASRGIHAQLLGRDELPILFARMVTCHVPPLSSCPEPS